MESSRRTTWWIVGLALALIAGVVISVLARGDLKRAVEGTSTHSPLSTLSTTTALPKSSTTTTAGDAGAPCHNGQIAVSGAGGGSGLGHQDQVFLRAFQPAFYRATRGWLDSMRREIKRFRLNERLMGTSVAFSPVRPLLRVFR